MIQKDLLPTPDKLYAAILFTYILFICLQDKRYCHIQLSCLRKLWHLTVCKSLEVCYSQQQLVIHKEYCVYQYWLLCVSICFDFTCKSWGSEENGRNQKRTHECIPRWRQTSKRCEGTAAKWRREMKVGQWEWVKKHGTWDMANEKEEKGLMEKQF